MNIIDRAFASTGTGSGIGAALARNAHRRDVNWKWPHRDDLSSSDRCNTRHFGSCDDRCASAAATWAWRTVDGAARGP